MKTRIATALSVVGVLGAGSAAALVNTQILDGGAAESSASAAVLPTASTVDVTIPEVPAETMPPETTPPSVPESSVPESSVPESTMPAEPGPTGYLTAFNVGEAGVVTVDVFDGLIVLVDAEPKPGWSISDISEDPGENEVEVEFASGTVRVEFEATVIDGQIVPKVTSRRVGAASAPAATPPSSGATPATTVAGDDEHDDDEHDDDEHDDDEHDDDEPDDDEPDDDEHEERDDD